MKVKYWSKYVITLIVLIGFIISTGFLSIAFLGQQTFSLVAAGILVLGLLQVAGGTRFARDLYLMRGEGFQSKEKLLDKENKIEKYD